MLDGRLTATSIQNRFWGNNLGLDRDIDLQIFFVGKISLALQHILPTYQYW